MSTDDAITAGTVAIDTSNSTTTLSNAAPGDSHYVFVTIQNTGSMGARVAVATAVPPSTDGDPEDETLGQFLWADADFNEPGAQTESECRSSDPSGPARRLDSDTVVPLVGSVEPLSQAGDAGVGWRQTISLCARYTLPLTAPNSAQDGIVDLILEFHAEQHADFNKFAYMDATYGTDSLDDDLATLNTSSGVWSDVGSFSSADTVQALAWDANLGVLYGAEDDPGANNQLLRIDPETGTETVVGTFGAAATQVIGLAYDPSSETLYGADQDNFRLVTIDASTGTASTVGPFNNGNAPITGLAHDPNTDTLYGIDGGAADELVTLNTSTGNASTIGTVGFNSSYALAFDPNSNTLYAVVSGSPDRLITINTSTGAGTLVTNLSGPVSNPSGLSFGGG